MFNYTKHNMLPEVVERTVLRIVVATGICSVVVQLVTIREFLAQFQGNEFVIALILFCWLMLGGVGTLLARRFSRHLLKVPLTSLAFLSLFLSIMAVCQIIGIRMLRDLVFTHGASVGFYPTLTFSGLTVAPYCMLLGFLLPFSLYVIRGQQLDYPGARIYIADSLGDASGGALFSFLLVFLCTPLQALMLVHLPLIGLSVWALWLQNQYRTVTVLTTGLVLLILVIGVWWEPKSLQPSEGRLIEYHESRFGRITMHRDQEQDTLFVDGQPVFSTQNIFMAEETVHYPLSQVKNPQHILVISSQSGIMTEIAKYHPQTIDYVELDPKIPELLFRHGLLQKIPGLNIIHGDGRAYLQKTKKVWDAIILNLPEPDTFQINRFFTSQFFALAKHHLAPDGVLSFSMRGFANYLSKPHQQKISTLYRTTKVHFGNVLLVPGQRVFFLCKDGPLNPDIPALLSEKKIRSWYIHGYYYGNITPERIEQLNTSMDDAAPLNQDESPKLMRLMFSQWFAKFNTSPLPFMVALAIIGLVYLIRITRPEFVLFSTGFMTMGSEILVIFTFQIFFGYIYVQIGLIVTVFLSGLLPGAWLGNRLKRRGTRLLAGGDAVLILLLIIYMVAIRYGGDHLPSGCYLLFGFCVSTVCGFQFPVALGLEGGRSAAVVRTFSADLMGAAGAALITSVILIPYCGLIWTAMGLIFLKLVSLFWNYHCYLVESFPERQ